MKSVPKVYQKCTGGVHFWYSFCEKCTKSVPKVYTYTSPNVGCSSFSSCLCCLSAAFKIYSIPRKCPILEVRVESLLAAKMDAEEGLVNGLPPLPALEGMDYEHGIGDDQEMIGDGNQKRRRPKKQDQAHPRKQRAVCKRPAARSPSSTPTSEQASASDLSLVAAGLQQQQQQQQSAGHAQTESKNNTRMGHVSLKFCLIFCGQVWVGLKLLLWVCHHVYVKVVLVPQVMGVMPKMPSRRIFDQDQRPGCLRSSSAPTARLSRTTMPS